MSFFRPAIAALIKDTDEDPFLRIWAKDQPGWTRDFLELGPGASCERCLFACACALGKISYRHWLLEVSQPVPAPTGASAALLALCFDFKASGGGRDHFFHPKAKVECGFTRIASASVYACPAGMVTIAVVALEPLGRLLSRCRCRSGGIFP
ncbi:hypothetical protein ACLKA7_001285 [Drosophila subpalustris]